jgi:hypothetical protein
MGLKNKLGIGAFVVLGTAVSVGLFVGSLKLLDEKINRDEEMAMVYQILDKDRNGKLSEDEKEAYYKVTGFNPGLHSITSPSRDDMKTFLSLYTSK